MGAPGVFTTFNQMTRVRESEILKIPLCNKYTEFPDKPLRQPEVFFLHPAVDPDGDIRDAGYRPWRCALPENKLPPPIVIRSNRTTGSGRWGMRLSQSTGMAIDSLFYMSMHPEKSHLYVDDVAAAQNVSATYLAKVFQQLAKNGILRSQRGAKGGYRFGRLPEEISLFDIVSVCEGNLQLFDCRPDERGCTLEGVCLVCRTFREIEDRIRETLRQVTVGDLRDHHTRQGTLPAWVGCDGPDPDAYEASGDVPPEAFRTFRNVPEDADRLLRL